MKCEHCKEKEATFYYRSVVNGEVSEVHLCEDCAEKLGYRAGFGVDFAGGFDDLFSLLPRVAGANGFFDMPRFTPAAHRTLRVLPSEEQEDDTCTLGTDEQAELRRERERNAKRIALDEALAAEDYERAALLRDELKQLEDGTEQ